MSLYVRETGPADAPAIVFLHGGGGAGWMWQPQVGGLGEFHCLVPDLPEHGRSVDVKPFTIAGSAELIAELIRMGARRPSSRGRPLRGGADHGGVARERT